MTDIVAFLVEREIDGRIHYLRRYPGDPERWGDPDVFEWVVDTNSASKMSRFGDGLAIGFLYGALVDDKPWKVERHAWPDDGSVRVEQLETPFADAALVEFQRTLQQEGTSK